MADLPLQHFSTDEGDAMGSSDDAQRIENVLAAMGAATDSPILLDILPTGSNNGPLLADMERLRAVVDLREEREVMMRLDHVLFAAGSGGSLSRDVLLGPRDRSPDPPDPTGVVVTLSTTTPRASKAGKLQADHRLRTGQRQRWGRR